MTGGHLAAQALFFLHGYRALSLAQAKKEGGTDSRSSEGAAFSPISAAHETAKTENPRCGTIPTEKGVS